MSKSNFQKLFVLLTTVFFALSGVFLCDAWAQNKVGWSADQQQLWTQMYNENHPLWQRLKSQADTSNLYGDDGLRDGLVYLITGDTSYAYSAWQRVNWWCGDSYRPSGCAEPSRNSTRHNFTNLAILYDWISDALSSTDRANYRDILDHWVDLVFSTGHGTRTWDSDEMTGHYFGVACYAVALMDEDPTRASEILNFAGNDFIKPVGGLDATGANTSTWRNTIKRYTTGISVGGEWLESSNYNLGTLQYLLMGASAINAYYGEDKFPDVTALYDDFAEAMVQQMTPNFRDSFQWGDEQNPHDLRYWNRVPLMAMVSALSRDPEALYLFDVVYEANGTTNTGPSWPYFVDPYSSRQAPAGITSHHASGHGIAYHHSGWGSNDSFYASTMFNYTYVDHDRESLTNFNLYRNGGWAVSNPKGYYGGKVEGPYMNGMLISGGVAGANEAFGEGAFEAGDTFLYHSGTTGGQLVHSNYYDPPLEFVHEWNRSTMYWHNTDGSDTIVVFDRLNVSDPKDTNTMPTWRYERIPDYIEERIDAANAYHQWILHIPDANPNISGDTIKWHADNGEEVTLRTLVDDYSLQIYDEQSLYNAGHPLYLTGVMRDGELKYQLRIIPTQKTGFLTLANVVHVGSQADFSKLLSVADEDAVGVLMAGVDTYKLAIFNGTENTPPSPTPFENYRAAHDPERFSKTNSLRLFKTGFVINVNSDAYTEVYIADLDPAKAWTISIDGTQSALNVSDQGFARHEFWGTGTHQIRVSSTDQALPVAVIQVASTDHLTVHFDGSQSFLPDAGYSYEWDFGDGQTSSEESPVHTYAQTGEYTVTLTVSDGSLSDDDTTSIAVGDINHAPVISVSGDASIETGGAASVNVSASDSDGDPLTLTAHVVNGDVLDEVTTLGAVFVDNGDGTGTLTWSPVSGQDGDYTFRFSVSDGVLSNMADHSISVSTLIVAISKANWTLIDFDSQEMNSDNDAAVNAFDDDTTSEWHTEWYYTSPEHPHYIIVDLGATYDVSGFRYLPRQDGGSNGNVKDYEFYISEDGIAWDSLAASGSFVNSSSEKEVLFNSVHTGRYFKFVALSEVNGNPWTCVAEIGVLGSENQSLTYCGDAKIEGEEVCDGNSRSCIADDGYVGTETCNAQCTGFGSCVAEESCGDGILNGNETCDGEGQSCTTAEGYSGTQACKSDCSGYNTECVTTESCGDGTTNGDEACDADSQSCTTAEGYAGTETCNAQCSGYGSCSTSEYCGDGTTNGNEICDTASRVCVTADGYSGTQTCSDNCSAFGACTTSEYCGDGMVNGSEVCDSNAQSCTTTDGYAGTQLCDAHCGGFGTCSTTESCGDGTVNGNEQCDDGNNSGGDGCSAGCRLESQAVHLGRDATISVSTVHFSWDSDPRASAYWLSVGTTFSSVKVDPWGDIYSQNVHMATSQTVTGIPLNNTKIYVRLWTLIDGAWWTKDYSYQTTASGQTDVCGDGMVTGSEICDNDSEICTTEDGYAGSRSCNDQCSGYSECIATEYCGDGMTNGKEVCDSNVQSCTTTDGYAGTQSCDDQCSAFASCVSAEYCGDGTVNGSEQCDDGNTNNNDGCDASCMTEVDQDQSVHLGDNAAITSATVNFSWDSDPRASAYWLSVGTTFSSVKVDPWGDIYSKNVHMATSQTVTGIPLNNTKIYVRLWILIDGAWWTKDYSYQTRP